MDISDIFIFIFYVLCSLEGEMVGISPDRDGNSFRAYPVTHLRRLHFGGSPIFFERQRGEPMSHGSS